MKDGGRAGRREERLGGEEREGARKGIKGGRRGSGRKEQEDEVEEEEEEKGAAEVEEGDEKKKKKRVGRINNKNKNRMRKREGIRGCELGCKGEVRLGMEEEK